MKIICFILMLVSFAFPAHAETHYPPYPDVWGYDLSEYPAIRNHTAGGVSLYKMENGDIGFIIEVSNQNYYDKKGVYQVKNVRYMLLEFFSGKRTMLSGDELNAFDDIHRKDEFDILDVSMSHYYDKKIIFRDGSTLTASINNTSNLCRAEELSSYLELKDKTNHLLKKITILGAYPKVSKEYGTPYCEDSDSPKSYRKRLYFFPANVIKLEDDTMIMFSYEPTLIIRLNKDLTTHFIPTSQIHIKGKPTLQGNLFFMDYDKVEQLMVRGEQHNHDNLLNYIATHQQELLPKKQ